MSLQSNSPFYSINISFLGWGGADHYVRTLRRHLSDEQRKTPIEHIKSVKWNVWHRAFRS